MARDAYNNSSFLKIFHVLILVVYPIITIIFSFKAYYDIKESSGKASDITENWKSGAIMDVAVSQSCPTGFDEAITYKWPGTRNGCDCRDVSYMYRNLYDIRENIYTSNCNWNQTMAGCVDIKGSNAVKMDHYGRINGTNMKICILRSNDTWLNVAPVSGVECNDPNMRRCGSSKENVFCTKESKCPISQIHIVTLNDSSCLYENGCVLLTNYENKNKALVFKRGDQYDALPTAEFRLNEYGMCVDKDQDNITPGRKEFWLMNEERTTCNNLGDNLWNLTDASYNEYQLFDINNMRPTIDRLTEYGYYPPGKNGKDYHWNLYTRSYIPWAADCRDKMNDFDNKIEKLGSVQKAQLNQVIANCIVGFIVGIVVTIGICSSDYSGWVKVLGYGGKIAQSVFSSLAFLLAKDITNYFIDILDQQCSTGAVMNMLKEVNEETSNVYNHDLITMVAIGVGIAFDILLILYSICGGDNEEYETQVNIEAQTIMRRNDDIERFGYT